MYSLSLRGRLAAVMLPVFVIGMILVYVTARNYGELTANRTFDRLLEGSAISILETVAVSGNEVRVDVPYAALEMLSAAPDDRVFYRVIGADGRTLTGYEDLPAIATDARTSVQNRSTAAAFFDAIYRGEPLRLAVTGRELVVDGRKSWVWVQVGQTRLARDSVTRESIAHALWPIAALTAASLALVWFGISSALRPLRLVGVELSARAPGDLHPIDAAVPAEMRPLTMALNGFMGRLDVNLAAMKSFIADASHQLRTPLAALLTQAYVTAHDDPAELRRSLDAVERSGRKLAHLLNQLLSDATISHRAGLRRFQSINLVEILSSVISETVRAFDESDVRMKTSLKAAPLLGDRLMLEEAFKNILVNAIRHGEGEVELALARGKDEYNVAISDRGPGIPVEQRATVFERFARAGRSVQGAGIGLAIAKQAIESHGGAISLVDRDGGGITVRVVLPRGEA